jgi:hypothetical protein
LAIETASNQTAKLNARTTEQRFVGNAVSESMMLHSVAAFHCNQPLKLAHADRYNLAKRRGARMGYSHYWEIEQEIGRESFSRIVDDVQRMILTLDDMGVRCRSYRVRRVEIVRQKDMEIVFSKVMAWSL